MADHKRKERPKGGKEVEVTGIKAASRTLRDEDRSPALTTNPVHQISCPAGCPLLKKKPQRYVTNASANGPESITGAIRYQAPPLILGGAATFLGRQAAADDTASQLALDHAHADRRKTMPTDSSSGAGFETESVEIACPPFVDGID